MFLISSHTSNVIGAPAWLSLSGIPSMVDYNSGEVQIKTVLYEAEDGRQGLAVAVGNEPVAEAVAREISKHYGHSVDYIRFVDRVGQARYRAVLSSGREVIVTVLSNRARGTSYANLNR